MLSPIAYIIWTVCSSLATAQNPYTTARDSNGYGLSLPRDDERPFAYQAGLNFPLFRQMLINRLNDA